MIAKNTKNEHRILLDVQRHVDMIRAHVKSMLYGISCARDQCEIVNNYAWYGSLTFTQRDVDNAMHHIIQILQSKENDLCLPPLQDLMKESPAFRLSWKILELYKAVDPYVTGSALREVREWHNTD